MLLPFRKIICPVDFSEPSLEALQAASELATHFQGKLFVMHVVPPVPMPYQPIAAPAPELEPTFHVPSYQLKLTNSSERALKDLIDQHISPDLTVQAVVSTGDAATEIMATAEKEEADVIVIATHGQTGWRRVVFGSGPKKWCAWRPVQFLLSGPPSPKVVSKEAGIRLF
jgi:nucleotide-binding universal stress UspA family protein